MTMGAVSLRPTAALDFTRAVFEAGRNAGPALMFDWWYGGKLTLPELRAVIGDVWMAAEWPAASLGQAEWIELFRLVGFVSDDGRPPPTEPLVVYRGTTWGRRRGMSWTLDPLRAEWFADRWTSGGRGEGLVFKTRVDPGAVLALLGDPDGRNEEEIVVDPTLLPPITRRCVQGESTTS